MGANQSAGTGSGRKTEAGGQPGAGDVKICYYELLGIDRQASEEE